MSDNFELHDNEFDSQVTLSKIDEEAITEMTYLMTEHYYPADEVIYNKGDELDSIILVLEGEIHVSLRSSHTQEFIIEKLTKRCSYGYYSILQGTKDEAPKSKYRLVSKTDTTVLKLSKEVLNKMKSKSKTLSKTFNQEVKTWEELTWLDKKFDREITDKGGKELSRVMPDCDF